MLKTCLLLLLELAPLFIFFSIGQLLPFLDAVLVYLVATTITITVIWTIARRISYLALIFGAVIIGAGSLSIWFNNPDILLLSDTLYYVGASILLYVLALRQRNMMKFLFDSVFGMNAAGWDILNKRWMYALLLAGISNELVRQLGTTDDWLWFQLIRTLALLIFATYQFTLTKKYRLPQETNHWGVRV